MFAHVTTGTVDQVGQPPALVFDGSRWQDLRSRDLDLLASVGWYPVTETPRPADTPTTTWDSTFVPGDGDVDQIWIERAKTADELLATSERENQRTIEQALGDALAEVQTIIDATNATINAGPAPYIKIIARAVRRIIRLVIRRFEGTS